ncbi:hypothetical protein SAMN02745857_04194 [Andreprevotia lacus DSM 23236]|uniref:Uncharacterized protein n=1 Tax=Andreprevotia lacus DSM 23236 TaxID=1121001 RepID=A0A1W1Y108_9NEIS|nr:hypothetical protein [Andreprevotia lacus]SMC29853.1 hypothetical protein SAMN02745857_04194 [Andreprevotia lacus DSM 23236]
MRYLLMLGLLALAGLGMVGCGSGDSSAMPTPVPTAVPTTPPSSGDAFTSQVAQIAGSTSDNTEPVDVSGITPVSSETAQPVAVK